MRICFVCTEYPPGPHGGIGTMVQQLARGLTASGHDVRVIGIHPASYPAPDEETDQGVRVWRLREPLGRLGWLAGRRTLYRAIAAWSAAGEVDLVEVPDWQGWAAGWPRMDVPVIARANGSLTYFHAEMGMRPPRAARWIERSSLRRADAWCAVSRYTGERTRRLMGLRRGPDAILPNAIELPMLAPRPFAARSRTRVVFTGSLVVKKGIADLIDAWPAVVEAVPGAELHVYGKDGRVDGHASMRAMLESRLPEAARHTVTFHGHVDRTTLFDALATARVAIFPSYSEACALAPIEALAMGCPVIHTRLSSGPEVIRDEVDGLLVDPRDRAEIVDALRRILTDDALAERLGEHGPVAARERFSLEHAVPRNVAFYEECIARFHRPAPRR